MKFTLLAAAWIAIIAFAYGKIFLGTAPFSGAFIFYAIVCLGILSLAQVAVECVRAMRKKAKKKIVADCIKFIVLAVGWTFLLILLRNPD